MWRGGFDKDVIEKGSGSFAVGDNSANDAVDELVRTMADGTVRRATIPASFNFDADPARPTYLELRAEAPTPTRKRRDCLVAENSTSVVLRPWLARGL